jgi:adenylate kinase family enzyme
MLRVTAYKYILIGLPRSGKTDLARYIGQKMHINVVETDALLKQRDRKEWRNIMSSVLDTDGDFIMTATEGCVENHQVFHRFLNRKDDERIIQIMSPRSEEQELQWQKKGKWYHMISDYIYWNTPNQDFFEWFTENVNNVSA